MKTYGLIGNPLSHSWSPAYFAKKFEKERIAAQYKLFPLEDIQELPRLISENPEISGLNITIPYKRSVIPFLDGLSHEAAAVMAVNTMVFRDDMLIGHNTDIFGFEQTLDKLDLISTYKALIFGTGGASAAVQYVLQNRNIDFISVSRKKSDKNLTYSDLTKSEITSHRLLINTTPLGMYPEKNAYVPIPYQAITPNHVAIDLIYNPEQTRFLALAAGQGAKTENGLYMLQQQAERSWQLWQA